MRIDVLTNFPELVAKMRSLGKALEDRAITAALNKTADKAKTEAVRAITEEYALKAQDVRARLSVRRASAKGSRLVAELEAFGRRRGKRSMNVVHFLERSVSLAEMRRRRKGGTLNQLRFRIKRGGGLKLIQGAFLGNQGRTLFERIPGSTMASRSGSGGVQHRQAIRPVETIDLPQMFSSRKINKRVVDRIMREFPVEFERAAAQVLRSIK